MDTNDTTTTDIVITDEAVMVEDSSNESFGKAITKTLVTSVATTAGMVGGMIVIGFAVQKFQQFKTARASRKTVIEGEVVSETPDSPETENA